jgi:hypothetical protein
MRIDSYDTEPHSIVKGGVSDGLGFSKACDIVINELYIRRLDAPSSDEGRLQKEKTAVFWYQRAREVEQQPLRYVLGTIS